jgi:hypothetical protein
MILIVGTFYQMLVRMSCVRVADLTSSGLKLCVAWSSNLSSIRNIVWKWTRRTTVMLACLRGDPLGIAVFCRKSRLKYSVIPMPCRAYSVLLDH